MKISQALRRAQKRIENPEHWHKGMMRCGDKYCMAGAIVEDSGTGYSPALGFLSDLSGRYSIVHWNDMRGTTHDEVMMAFDFAILCARSEGL